MLTPGLLAERAGASAVVMPAGTALIRITAKGLAEFATATELGKRKVLRDFKFPDPEGQARATYYREARETVRTHHAERRDAAWLASRARRLAEQAAALESPRSRARLANNARGIAQYAANFADREFDVQPGLRFSLTYGAVLVAVTPDLVVVEGGVPKIIKLEFSEKVPDTRVFRMMSQLLYEAALQGGLVLRSNAALYLDVARGKEHRGARVGARMAREIAAACENVAALWDGIAPPRR